MITTHKYKNLAWTDVLESPTVEDLKILMPQYGIPPTCSEPSFETDHQTEGGYLRQHYLSHLALSHLRHKPKGQRAARSGFYFWEKISSSRYITNQ